MYTYPAHRQWPMPSPSGGTLTIFWDNQHESGVLCMDNGGNIRGIHTASTLPHRWNRQHSHIQLVYELQSPISGQGYIRYPQGVGWHMQGVLHYWPYCWPICALLQWTGVCCIEWIQSVSWLMTDVIGFDFLSVRHLLALSNCFI